MLYAGVVGHQMVGLKKGVATNQLSFFCTKNVHAFGFPEKNIICKRYFFYKEIFCVTYFGMVLGVGIIYVVIFILTKSFKFVQESLC